MPIHPNGSPGYWTIVDPGLRTTIQDLGRVGFRSLGVPVSGAFDRESAGLANALVGNPLDAAVLELTLSGGLHAATVPVAFAIAGAPMPVRIEDSDDSRSARTITLPGSGTLLPGQHLRFTPTHHGTRTYIAVHQGFLTEPLLGSRSWEQPLEAGTQLPIRASRTRPQRPTDGSTIFKITESALSLDVAPAPDWMSAPQPWRDYWKSPRTCLIETRSNRVGIRLRMDGEQPTTPWLPSPDRLSRPVAPGAVQWTGSSLLVLGPACGTIGGYPHVGQLAETDLDRLAQGRPQTTLQIQWNDEPLGDNDTLWRRREARLRRFAWIRLGAQEVLETWDLPEL